MHLLIQWIKKWVRRVVILFFIVGVVTVICLVSSLFSDDSADAPTNEGVDTEVTQAPKKRVYRPSVQSKSSESVSAKQTNKGSKKVAVPIPQQEKPQAALKKGAYFGIDIGQPISEIPSDYIEKDRNGSVCEFKNAKGEPFVRYRPPESLLGPLSKLGEDLPREICVTFDDDRNVKDFVYAFVRRDGTAQMCVNGRDSDVRLGLGDQEYRRKLVADYRALTSFFEKEPNWKRNEEISVKAKNERMTVYESDFGLAACVSCATRSGSCLMFLLSKTGNEIEYAEKNVKKLENDLEQYHRVMRLHESKEDQERESKRLRGILGDKLLGRIYDEYGLGEWKSFVSKYEGQIKNAERKKPIPQREESATDIMIGVLEEGLKSSREKFESLKPGEGRRRVLQAQIDGMMGKLNKQKKIRQDEEAKHLKKIQKDIAAQNAELAGISREMGGQLKSSIEDEIRKRIDAGKQRVTLAKEKARAKEEAERARAEEERRREEEARKARIARKRQQLKPDYERAKEWYRDQLEYLGVSELHFGKYRETTQLVLHDKYGAQLNIVLNDYPEGSYIIHSPSLAKGFAEHLIEARVLIYDYEKGDF